MVVRDEGRELFSADLNERQTKVIYFLLKNANIIHENENVSDWRSRLVTINASIDNYSAAQQLNYFFQNALGTPDFFSLGSKHKVIAVKLLADRSLLDISQFGWIDSKNDRLCYFVWLKILDIKVAGSDSLSPSIYFSLPINKSPVSVADKRAAVIDFFDLSSATIQEKINMLESIRMQWSIAERSSNFKWIDKQNLNQCHWAIEQLKLHFSISFPGPYRSDADLGADKYGAFIAMTDVWNVSQDQKELLARRMRDEWEKFSKSLKKSEKKIKKIFAGEY
jgi:hypothetical protein